MLWASGVPAAVLHPSSSWCGRLELSVLQRGQSLKGRWLVLPCLGPEPVPLQTRRAVGSPLAGVMVGGRSDLLGQAAAAGFHGESQANVKWALSLPQLLETVSVHGGEQVWRLAQRPDGGDRSYPSGCQRMGQFHVNGNRGTRRQRCCTRCRWRRSYSNEYRQH